MNTEAQRALVKANIIQSMYDQPNLLPGDGFLIKTQQLDDRCFIGKQLDPITKEPYILVAFAGTRNLEQWLNNLKQLGKPKKNTDGSKCHPGAKETMQHFFPLLLNALKEIKACIYQEESLPVHVAGHSRGGFLADEFIRVFGARVKITAVDTFGAPKTGDSAYNKILAKNIAGTYLRWTNNNDPVVLLPSYLQGYRHFGHLRHFNANGKIISHAQNFITGPIDGLKGRFSALIDAKSITKGLKNFAIDGINDHRLITGYIPRLLSALYA